MVAEAGSWKLEDGSWKLEEETGEVRRKMNMRDGLDERDERA